MNSLHLPHGSRYALLHGSLAIIGMGSFIFHLTLKWHAQARISFVADVTGLEKLTFFFTGRSC